MISIFILIIFWYLLVSFKKNHRNNNKNNDKISSYEKIENKFKNKKNKTKAKFSTPKANNPNSLQICVATFGKMENYIAKDFVEWHKRIGVDKIYIYDNNEINGERFEDVLQEYIDDKLVEIIDKRGNHIPDRHVRIVNEHYKKYNNQCDWIIYIDLDELIYIKNKKTLGEYLTDKKFNKCKIIKLFWEIHGDNEQLNYKQNWMWERFPQPSKNLAFSFKSFVRGNLTSVHFPDVHQPWIYGHEKDYYIACNSVGNKITLNEKNPYNRPLFNSKWLVYKAFLWYLIYDSDKFQIKKIKK